MEFSKITTILNLSRKATFPQRNRIPKIWSSQKMLKNFFDHCKYLKMLNFQKTGKFLISHITISKNFFKKEIYKLPTTGSSYTSPWKFAPNRNSPKS